jgi:hypothetical protein
MKHEKDYELSLQEEEAKLNEAKEILEGKRELNMMTAKPHLYHVINFLANFFVRFLPTAKCLGCNQRLVSKLKRGLQDPMRPERSYCGHWMHFKCFEEFVI